MAEKPTETSVPRLSVPQQVVDTCTANIWLNPDGILCIRYKRGAYVDLNDAREVIAAAAQLAEGLKRPMFIDAGGVKYITLEARRYFAGEEAARPSSCQAFLDNSLIGRLVGSFFVGLDKLKNPTKLFRSKAAAVAWLKAFIK